jgi:argonaute-like protein implicated in RNA metabolism and viral defense
MDGENDTNQTDIGQIADAAPAMSELEEVAKAMGWHPEDEFTGDKTKWKPAREFVLAEREINRGMKDTVRRLTDTVERMAQAGTKQTERMMKKQADDLNARFQEAVENKDAKAAAAAVRELRELESESINTASTSNVEDDFAKRNPWYNRDEEATAYAVSVCQREAAKGKSVEDQLAAVDVAMKKRFPELVGGVVDRKEPPVVNAPGRSVSKPKGKTYADLPAEVKAAADRFANLAKTKHGVDPEKTKAQYAKDFFDDN